MRQFTLKIEAQQDIPAVLSECLANMGSLAASREQWASLLNALGVDLWFEYHKDAPKKSVEASAEAIVVATVPEEGEIHPQRARVSNLKQNMLQFETPNSVRVTIMRSVGGINLQVEFHRESTYLATLILADMFRRVSAAAPLLAQAAAEAAEKELAKIAS